MELKDVKTLTEVAEIYNIPVQTLHSRLRLNKLIENVDYRKLGERMPVLLSPEGIKKLTGKEKDKKGN